MKLTKSKLKKIIKEELQAILYEGAPEMCYSERQRALLTALERDYPDRDVPGHPDVAAYAQERRQIIPEDPCQEEHEKPGYAGEQQTGPEYGARPRKPPAERTPERTPPHRRRPQPRKSY